MSTIITYKKDTLSGKEIAKTKNLGFTSYSERKYEPQTQNTFAFEFLFDPMQVAYIATYANRLINNDDVTGATPISVTDYFTGLKQINEILNSSMNSLTSPTKSLGQINIDFFNSQIKFAGKPTYNNASITFNTLIGLGSKNVLAAWSDLCLSDRTLAGGWARTENKYLYSRNVPTRGTATEDQYLNDLFPHTGYKVDGVLLECARDGTIVNQWQYIGMWVQQFTPGNFSMSGANTPSQTSATIMVDKIQQSDVSYVSQLSPSKTSGQTSYGKVTIDE